MSYNTYCRIFSFVSDNNIRIEIDINVNIPDNLRSCSTCSRIGRAVQKREYLRIGYCEKGFCLKRGAGTEYWRKLHNKNFMIFSRN